MSNDELQKAIDDITNGEAAMDAGSDSSTDTGDAIGADMGAMSAGSASGADDDILGTPPTPDISSGMPAGLADATNPATEAAPSVDEGAMGPDPLDGFDPSGVTLNTTVPVEAAPAGEASASGMPTDLGVPTAMADATAVSAAPVENSTAEAPAEPLVAPVENNLASVEAAALPGTDDVEAAALKELYPLLPKMNVNPRQKFDICMKVIEKTGEKGAAAVALESAKAISDETEKGECLLKLIETFKS